MSNINTTNTGNNAVESKVETATSLARTDFDSSESILSDEEICNAFLEGLKMFELWAKSPIDEDSAYAQK